MKVGILVSREWNVEMARPNMRAATVARKQEEQAYSKKYGREFPKGKKLPREGKKRFDKQPVREETSVVHYEERPESAAVFVERMMCLGFSFVSISEQCELKYMMNPDATRKMIDRIRDSWRLFTTLPEDDKRIEMEQQLNNIMRLALAEGDFSAATVCMKRKMELNGLQPQRTPNNAQGITITQLLGDEIALERKEALANVRKK